jgi:hypothetical protein
MTGATSGAGTALSFWAPDFTPIHIILYFGNKWQA